MPAPFLADAVRRWVAIGGVACLGVGACKKTDVASRPDAVAEALPPLEGARFSGCAAVRADGVCEVGAEPVRVWVPAKPEEVHVFFEGVPVEPSSRTETRGGTRLSVAPGTAKRLDVRASGREMRLPLAPATPKPDVVKRAAELREAGKLAEARALLEADRARAEQAGEGAAVVALLARIALAEGRDEDVDKLFDASIAQYEAKGRLSEAADDAFALAFSLMSRVRLNETRRVLERAERLSRGYPDGQARVAYYTASLFSMSSRSREALELGRKAEDESDRLGLVRVNRLAQQLEASILDDLGRVSDALDILDAQRREAEAQMAPCELGDLYRLRGIVGTHARDLQAADARQWLTKAIEIFHTRCPAPPDPARVAHLETYLARAELRIGRFAEAEEHLRASTAASEHPRIEVLLDRLLTRAELEHARKQPALAVPYWEEAELRARAIGNDDFLRIALDGRARSLAALRRDKDALLALEQAAALADRMLVDVPIGEGRESFAREQEQDDVRRVQILVQGKRPRDAAREVLRIRSRVLDTLSNTDRLASLSPQALEEWTTALSEYRRSREALEEEGAEDWKLSSTKLAQVAQARAVKAEATRAALDAAIARLLPSRAARATGLDLAPKEAILAIVPVDREWVAVFVTDRAARAVALGVVDANATPESLSHSLLDPFRKELSKTTRLSVAALGAARRVDVHALPWDDDAPLLAKMAVTYPVDRRGSTVTDPAITHALVVGDPTSDLAFARREIEVVSQHLGAVGVPTDVLSGPQATGSQVRTALASARLFHYAGHGKYAGRDGWQSALPLADHSELAVADILALPRVPEAVVLLGCETARTSEAGQAEGLGLAQAFLVAGAQAVVASTRTVDDEAAAIVASALYDHLRPGGDVAEALRAAQMDARKSGVADFGAFRVLVR